MFQIECDMFRNNIEVRFGLHWVPQLFELLEFSPFNPIVNKSCQIECCGNKMHQIVQNMILSQGLELKLSLC